MAAKLSIDGMQKAAKGDESDPAHVQYEVDEREPSLDNTSSRNVKATSPGAKQGTIPMLSNMDQPLICLHCTTDSKYTVVGSRSESQLKDHTKRAAAIQGRVSTKTLTTLVSQSLEDCAEIPRPSGRKRQVHNLGGLRKHTDGPGDVTDSTILESEQLIHQPKIGMNDYEDAWTTCSDSEHSIPSTDFISHDQEDSCRGSTKSDVAMCGSESSLSDSTNSISSSEISYPRYPTSHNIASQGVGTQFEWNSPLIYSLETPTLPTKDEAEYISDGVTRARASMSDIESLNRDACEELPYSKDRRDSQVPHDVSLNDEGLEDLDDMEEDDGGWHKLPSQQWKWVQQSQSLSESTSFLVSLYLRKRMWRKRS